MNEDQIRLFEVSRARVVFFFYLFMVEYTKSWLSEVFREQYMRDFVHIHFYTVLYH